MSVTKLGALASFKEIFDGRFTGPEDDRCATLLAECVWNGDIDRHPRGIARCTTASDVATAIRFARDTGLEFTVRGGGHNFAGSCVADGALMIDLGPMCHVHVDPARKRPIKGNPSSPRDPSPVAAATRQLSASHVTSLPAGPPATGSAMSR